MKLLYVTKQLPFGAAEAFIYAELAHHVAKGHEVTVVPVQTGPLLHENGRALLSMTLAQPVLSARILAAFLAEAVRHPLRVMRALWRTLDLRRPRLLPRNMAVWMKGVWLARELRLRGVDHMHVHWISVPATMGMIAAEIARIPFSITAHRYDIAQGNLVAEKFARAAFVRAIDAAGAAELAAQLRPEQMPPVVVRMGVDVPRTQVMLRDGPLSPMRGLIGARFIAKKGHATLIEAVALARSKGQAVEIDCYGDGPLQPAMEARVAELGLQDAIRFCGVASHDALQRHLAGGAYDFAVLPSVTAPDGDKEGIPVFLMEAMAVGLPVIATPNGGIPELISPGAGVLVPEYDVPALAEALLRLAGQGALRLSLASNGRKSVLEHFAIDSCMDQLETLIRHTEKLRT